MSMPVNDSRRMQFTLRSLLGVVLPASVYLAQLAAVSIFTRWEPSDWRRGGAILFAWVVLAIYYLRHRLFWATIVHCVGFAVGITRAVSLPVFSGGVPSNDVAELVVVSLACFIGSSVSFPLALLEQLIRALRGRDPGRAAERAGPGRERP